jgi:hypothetical protein
VSIGVGSIVRVKPSVSGSLYGNIFGIIVDMYESDTVVNEFYVWSDAMILTKEGTITSIPSELLEEVNLDGC